MGRCLGLDGAERWRPTYGPPRERLRWPTKAKAWPRTTRLAVRTTTHTRSTTAATRSTSARTPIARFTRWSRFTRQSLPVAAAPSVGAGQKTGAGSAFDATERLTPSPNRRRLLCRGYRGLEGERKLARAGELPIEGMLAARGHPAPATYAPLVRAFSGGGRRLGVLGEEDRTGLRAGLARRRPDKGRSL